MIPSSVAKFKQARKKNQNEDGFEEDLDQSMQELRKDEKTGGGCEDGGKSMIEVNWENVIDDEMIGLDCSDADMVPVYKSHPENDHIGDLQPQFKQFD